MLLPSSNWRRSAIYVALTAGVLFVRVTTLGALQRIALQIQSLIVRRDTSIADPHGAKLFRWYR